MRVNDYKVMSTHDSLSKEVKIMEHSTTTASRVQLFYLFTSLKNNQNVCCFKSTSKFLPPFEKANDIMSTNVRESNVKMPGFTLHGICKTYKVCELKGLQETYVHVSYFYIHQFKVQLTFYKSTRDVGISTEI